MRRWRWELWEGATLLAAGWRLSPAQAFLALRTAASRRAHERLGVRALRPAATRAIGMPSPGATLRVDCGVVECLLVPREEPGARAPAAARAA